MSASIDCEALNTIKNSISQQLTDKVTQGLNNNQDVLGSLGQLLGSHNSQDIAVSVVNRINQILTTNVISDIVQTIQNNTSYSITSSGGTVVKGITQNTAYTSVMSYLTTTDIMDQMFSSSEWTTLTTAYNTQNTIGELGAFAVGLSSIFRRLVHSVLGQVMLVAWGIAAALFGILVFYTAYRFFSYVAKNKKAKALEGVQTKLDQDQKT